MVLRGATLEKLANEANLKYRKIEKALILKIPIPILYTTKGMIPQASTVDFAGLINGGTFIAFDAKETKNKTSFPLQNIHEHQLHYLNMVEKLGGIAFFLIHFTKVETCAYRTPLSLINKYWDNTDTGRKSIPKKDFKKSWLVPTDDYLKYLT